MSMDKVEQLISDTPHDSVYLIHHETTTGILNPMVGRTVARGMLNTPFSVFRAHRYRPDHRGLQRKELDPARYADESAERWRIAHKGQKPISRAFVANPTC